MLNCPSVKYFICPFYGEELGLKLSLNFLFLSTLLSTASLSTLKSPRLFIHFFDPIPKTTIRPTIKLRWNWQLVPAKIKVVKLLWLRQLKQTKVYERLKSRHYYNKELHNISFWFDEHLWLPVWEVVFERAIWLYVRSGSDENSCFALMYSSEQCSHDGTD